MVAFKDSFPSKNNDVWLLTASVALHRQSQKTACLFS